jgi:hypothetical protein
VVGETLDMTAVVITESDDVSFFDGATPGYEWAGTTNGSVSRSIPGVSTANRMRNPSVETGIGSWSANNGTYHAGSRDSTKSKVGTSSYKSTVLVTTGNVLSTYNLLDGTFNTPVTAGKEYTISAWFYTETAGRDATIGMVFRTPEDTNFPNSYAPLVTLTPGVWTRVVQTATAPVGAVKVYGISYGKATAGGNIPVGEEMWADAMAFVEGPDVGYFDGDSIGATWAGAAHNSTSLLLASEGDQQILSNQGKYDGLTINGTKVSFSTKYVNTGEAKCTYDMQIPQLVDVVGVHTKTKNSLFVNGERVAEVAITEEQQADVYDAPNTNLYSGLTTSSQGVMVNGLGVYTRALLPDEIVNIYNANQIRTDSNIPKMFGGEIIKVSQDVRPVAVTGLWTTADDWRNAELVSTSVDNEQLVASMADGVTLAGTWKDSISLYSGGVATTIDSANMDWDGENVSIEVSIDGTSWESVTRAYPINMLTGLNPANKELYIRATFNAGVTNAYLDTLRFNAYTASSITPPDGRPVTWTNPVVTMAEQEPLRLREDWGTAMMGGTITVGADPTDEPLEARTIEMWVKRNVANSFTTSWSATSVYSNGAVYAGGTTNIGDWTLMHYVLPANVSTFNFGGDITVGRVAIYDTALTAPQIAQIYALYTGNNYMVVDDGSDIIVSEPTTPAIIYAHDWEITAS